MKKTNDAQYEAARLGSAFRTVGKVDSLSKAQEVLAKAKGFNNWHELQQNLKQRHNLNYSLDINMAERAQFFLQNLPIEVVNCKPIKIPTRSEELNTKEYVLETKKEKLKRIFKKSSINTQITIKAENFPALALGFCGAGMNESFYNLKQQITAEGSGFIDINGKGCNTSYVKIFSLAESLNREKDVFLINFLTGYRDDFSSPKLTHTINPLEHFLLNKENFSNYFGKEISQWLYPALKSYEAKEQRVKLNSINTFLTLPQLMLMANSNEWNNRQETLEYLQSIGINPAGENSDEDIFNAMDTHTIKTARTYTQISYISHPAYSYLFSDEPEINFVDIISQKKICSILMPCLEKCTDELWSLKEIMNQMMLAADSLVGHQKFFIFSYETGEMSKTNCPSIHFAQDWVQHEKILMCPDNPDNLIQADPSFYKSFFLFRQDNLDCPIYEKMIEKNWHNAKLLKVISQNPTKNFTEGHALFIKDEPYCWSAEKIVFDYHQIKNSKNIYLNRIEK